MGSKSTYYLWTELLKGTPFESEEEMSTMCPKVKAQMKDLSLTAYGHTLTHSCYKRKNSRAAVDCYGSRDQDWIKPESRWRSPSRIRYSIHTILYDLKKYNENEYIAGISSSKYISRFMIFTLFHILADATYVFTWTDNKAMALRVACTSDNKEKSWVLLSMQPKVDEATQKLVLEEVAKLGFNTENTFIYSYYDNKCQGIQPIYRG